MALSVMVQKELSTCMDGAKSTIKSTLVCGDQNCPRISDNPQTVGTEVQYGFQPGDQIWIVHSEGPNEEKLCCSDCFGSETKLRLKSMETFNSTSNERWEAVDSTMTKAMNEQTRDEHERKKKVLATAVVLGRKVLGKWVEAAKRVELLKWGTSHDAKNRVNYKITDFEDEDEEEAMKLWKRVQLTETYKAKREFHTNFPQHAKKFLGENPSSKAIHTATLHADEAARAYVAEKEKILELVGEVKDLEAQVRAIDTAAGIGTESAEAGGAGGAGAEDAEASSDDGNNADSDDDEEQVDGKKKRKKAPAGGTSSKAGKNGKNGKKKPKRAPPRTVPFYEKADSDAFRTTAENRAKKIAKQVAVEAE